MLIGNLKWQQIILHIQTPANIRWVFLEWIRQSNRLCTQISELKDSSVILLNEGVIFDTCLHARPSHCTTTTICVRLCVYTSTFLLIHAVSWHYKKSGSPKNPAYGVKELHFVTLNDALFLQNLSIMTCWSGFTLYAWVYWWREQKQSFWSLH